MPCPGAFAPGGNSPQPGAILLRVRESFSLEPRGGSAIALVASADLGHSAVAVAVPIEETRLHGQRRVRFPGGRHGRHGQRCGPASGPFTFVLLLRSRRIAVDVARRSPSSPAAPGHSGTGS